MHNPLIRGLVWAACAAALLLVGLLGVLFLMYAVGIVTGRIAPERRQDIQLLMTIYFRVIALKGLLPQMVLCLALWPLITRYLPATTRSRKGLFLGLTLGASIAYAFVSPLLLATEFANWPGLQMVNTYQMLMSWLLMTAGVVAATFLVRVWLPGPRGASG